MSKNITYDDQLHQFGLVNVNTNEEGYGPVSATDIGGASQTSQLIQDDRLTSLETYKEIWTRKDTNTIRVLFSGQSNAVGSTVFSVIPTFDSRNLFWNGTSFVQAVFGNAPFDNVEYPYAPLLSEEIVNDTVSTINVESILTGQGATSITEWEPGQARFTEITTEYTNSGWTDPVDLFVWTQGEADSGMTTLEYIQRFQAVVAELDNLGITDNNTKFVITGLYLELFYLDEYRSVNYNRKSATLYTLSQYDPRFTFVSTLGLDAEIDSGNPEWRRVHFSEASARELPKRVRSTLKGTYNPLHPGLVPVTSTYGNIGKLSLVEKRLVSGDTLTLDYPDMVGQTVRVNTSTSDVNITLPPIGDSSQPGIHKFGQGWCVYISVDENSNDTIIDPNGKTFRFGNGKLLTTSLTLKDKGVVKIEWRETFWDVYYYYEEYSTFTPEISFVTPEDLSVNYALQLCDYERNMNTGVVDARFRIEATINWTVNPSGNLYVTLPYVASEIPSTASINIFSISNPIATAMAGFVIHNSNQLRLCWFDKSPVNRTNAVNGSTVILEFNVNYRT